MAPWVLFRFKILNKNTKGKLTYEKNSILIVALILGVSLTACNQQNKSANQSLASFSYEEDAAIYNDATPGANPNAFVNIDTYSIENQNAAVERAKNECTIAYNATSEYYDSSADMWRIDFLTVVHNEDGTVATSGDRQSVYMNGDGITQLIVYGE